MSEGEPHMHARPGTAAEFIVQMVHKYPGEVVLWAGGPLTNFALALKLDPSIATLAKEFVLMGGGLYADKGAIDPGAIDARREFNWWFDPEAARIVLRAPWKKMTITPIDISVKTRYTTEMKANITKAGTPVTEYLDKYSLPGYMWDEIAGAALIDPSIITGQKNSTWTSTSITAPATARRSSGTPRPGSSLSCAWRMFSSISTPRSSTRSTSI